MSKPIKKINLSVNHGTGKVVTIDDTANILIDVGKNLNTNPISIYKIVQSITRGDTTTSAITTYTGKIYSASETVYDTWAEGVSYAADKVVTFELIVKVGEVIPAGATLPIGGDDRIVSKKNYKALVANSSSEFNAPNLDSSVWEDTGDDFDLDVLARESDSTALIALGDLTNYSPWFEVDELVPVIKISGDKYILQTVTACGSDDNSSIRHNEIGQRIMAVFK